MRWPNCNWGSPPIRLEEDYKFHSILIEFFFSKLTCSSGRMVKTRWNATANRSSMLRAEWTSMSTLLTRNEDLNFEMIVYYIFLKILTISLSASPCSMSPVSVGEEGGANSLSALFTSLNGTWWLACLTCDRFCKTVVDLSKWISSNHSDADPIARNFVELSKCNNIQFVLWLLRGVKFWRQFELRFVLRLLLDEHFIIDFIDQTNRKP